MCNLHELAPYFHGSERYNKHCSDDTIWMCRYAVSGTSDRPLRSASRVQDQSQVQVQVQVYSFRAPTTCSTKPGTSDKLDRKTKVDSVRLPHQN